MSGWARGLDVYLRWLHGASWRFGLSRGGEGG